MAVIATRINGQSSQANYGFYGNVLVWDTINEQGGITVQVNTYIVNNGSRFNTNGWTKHTRIDNVAEETLTNQNINTTNVDRYGGETLIQSKTYNVPITMEQVWIASYITKSSYSSYEPGYSYFNGWVSMPKVQSTWKQSLLSISNVENAFTLPINKYVNDYYNVVEVRNSNNTTLVKTINDAVNGTSVTFSSGELNTIFTMDNNANQLPLVFYLDLKTYTNSSKTTQIGTTQRLKCEAYIVNGEPTATYTIVEQDAKVISLLSGDTSKIIKNASDLLFTITPTALKGSSISSVKINDVPATLDNNNYVLNVTNLTTGTFNIVITDSRGLTKTYTATKTLLDYIACQINTWSIERQTQVSSNLKLNANVNVWEDTINGTTNTIIVKYSIDNENWTTIPSSSYSISDNVLTITNLILNNIVNYKNIATFYLDISDLLSETKENYQIAKGVETYSWGENDLQINGDLFIADEDGENTKEIKTLICDLIYPIGSIYISVSDDTATKVHNRLGGTWEAFGTGRTLVGVDTSQTEFNSVEKTGGSKYIQEHWHTYRFGSSPGGDGTGLVYSSTAGTQTNKIAIGDVKNVTTGNSGNLQPYITCYMWKRTA